MIQIFRRPASSGRSCATCHYLQTGSANPDSECCSALRCGASDVSLLPYANSLTYVFCVNWQSIPDEQATAVFKDLTEIDL